MSRFDDLLAGRPRPPRAETDFGLGTVTIR
jgi:hypothetical protein